MVADSSPALYQLAAPTRMHLVPNLLVIPAYPSNYLPIHLPIHLSTCLSGYQCASSLELLSRFCYLTAYWEGGRGGVSTRSQQPPASSS